jgi:hypothetical protein
MRQDSGGKAMLMKGDKEFRPVYSACWDPEIRLREMDRDGVTQQIIDSRYANFKFSLEDVVADNCSSSAFVVGPWQAPDIDLSNLGMIMQVDQMGETGFNTRA